MDKGTPRSPLWPGDGVTRIPYRLYSDADRYVREQERIFKGPIWHYLCLETELPNRGDFVTAAVGETPILVTRGDDGALHAMVNRCAHRGALLCMDRRGNARQLTCVYHNWSYDLTGKIRAVAFKAGVRGKGGMPESFKMEEHNLRRLRVATFSGLVFGTFSDETPPIEEFLGPVVAGRIKRVLDRSLSVLGRNTQVLHSNWKIYMENIKDSYHASILHLFFTTFRINRLNTKGEILLDETGQHHVSYSAMDASIDNAAYGSQGLRADKNDLTLNDPEVVEWIDEHGDGTTLQILSVFPTLVVQQHLNALAVRHLRPSGVDTCEVDWIYLGYAGDNAAMTRRRLKQGNLVGPAGYISMEDGAVTGFVQRASKGVEEDAGVVMMGGEGVESQPFRATETAVRGFWKRYRELMGD